MGDPADRDEATAFSTLSLANYAGSPLQFLNFDPDVDMQMHMQMHDPTAAMGLDLSSDSGSPLMMHNIAMATNGRMYQNDTNQSRLTQMTSLGSIDPNQVS